MPRQCEPRLNILPAAQKEIWRLLGPATRLGLVLYGVTAVALHLGHRQSIDFDFFKSEPLDKRKVERSFAFMRDAKPIQESENTLVVSAQMPAGPVKISFFGDIKIGPLRLPLRRGIASCWSPLSKICWPPS